MLGTIFPGIHAMRPMLLQGGEGVIVNSTSAALCGMPMVATFLVVYLLSDRSRGITGQLIRLWGASLHLIGHPAPIAPSLERQRWSVEELDAAFRGPLRGHLQPFARDSSRYEWRGPK